MDEMRLLSDEETDAGLRDEMACHDGYKDPNMRRKALRLGDRLDTGIAPKPMKMCRLISSSLPN